MCQFPLISISLDYPFIFKDMVILLIRTSMDQCVWMAGGKIYLLWQKTTTLPGAVVQLFENKLLNCLSGLLVKSAYLQQVQWKAISSIYQMSPNITKYIISSLCRSGECWPLLWIVISTTMFLSYFSFLVPSVTAAWLRLKFPWFHNRQEASPSTLSKPVRHSLRPPTSSLTPPEPAPRYQRPKGLADHFPRRTVLCFERAPKREGKWM